VTAIRVVVADDHPAYRKGLASMLGDEPDITLVGEAENGRDALALCRELAPDVVVMDLRMPDLDGIEATRLLLKDQPAPAVIVLTMFEDDQSVFAAMRAGAQGYLLKGAEQDEIADAIRAVVRGQAIFGPGIAARLLDHFANPPQPVADPFPELSAREKEILELLAGGRRTAEIAATLHLSPKTVSNNLTSIFTKLEVSDRTAAVLRARERGMGS